MSWFDNGLAAFAKNALKEAQKTIDKALDIKAEQENADPLPSKSSSDILKLETEQFFSSFGVTEKKSPLSLSNDAVQLLNVSSKSRDGDTALLQVDSNPLVIATQPPRRTVQAVEPETVDCNQDFSSSKKSFSLLGAKSVLGDAWGGWGSSILLTTEDDKKSIGETELKDDSLSDDIVDLEGFSRSHLVVDMSCRDDFNSDDSCNNKSQSDLREVATAEETLANVAEVKDETLISDSATTSETALPLANMPIEVPDISSTISKCSGRDDTSTNFSSFSESYSDSLFTSPESVEVLGSNSNVTSPSSIEILSEASQQPEDSSISEVMCINISNIDSKTIEEAITKQPSKISIDEDLQKPFGELGDASINDSQHSTSTSSTHTVLEAYIPDNSLDGKICDSYSSKAEDEYVLGLEAEELEASFAPTTLTMSGESCSSIETVTFCKSTADSRKKGTLVKEERAEFAQDLLKDAICEDNSKNPQSSNREQSPSSSERSDLIKISSDQSSGDEVETGTSSDIEVISSPSINGTGSSVNHGSGHTTPVTSAYVIASRRGLKSLNIDGSLSPTSDNSSGENGRKMHNIDKDTIPSSMTTSFTSISESDCDASYSANNFGHFNVETSCLSSSHLKDFSSEKGHRRNKSSLSETSESSSENSEIDKLRKEVKAEAATRVSPSEFNKALEEKDVVIIELRSEGTKLSKQLLTYSTNLKKLRVKEKELEAALSTHKKKLEKSSQDLDRLQKQLVAKEEIERTQIEKIGQLHAANQQFEVKLKEVIADKTEAEGKLSALQDALESAFREVAEKNCALQECKLQAQELSLNAEVGARQELEYALIKMKDEAKLERETLLAQISELQDTLRIMENQWNRKERQFRSENVDLQQRLSDAEGRAEELSCAISTATRPILKQMESLQASQSTQRATWESLESNLTSRLEEAQNSLASSIQRERTMHGQYSTAASEIASLKAQISRLQGENSKLVQKVEQLNLQVSEQAAELKKEISQIQALRLSFTAEVSDMKGEKELLEQRLEVEQTALVAEKKKTASLEVQLKEKEIQYVRVRTPRSSPAHFEAPCASPLPDDVFDGTPPGRVTSVYDALRSNSSAALDVITSQLRQREGEVQLLQSEVTRLEAQRESLSQELVKLATQMEELQTQAEGHSQLHKLYDELQQRYNALLQMYGEKIEEVDELRLDLNDVKEMYKLQIDELMKK